MKKSSHQRRSRPGTAPNAEGHSLPGSDHLDHQPGRAISGRMDAAITSASLRGDTITFAADGREYSGKVSGDRIDGTVKGSISGKWSATRVR